MVKARTSAVKKKPGDFKRPKRKVGRKAPQAANVTSVAISSRRINMLEQSVLQDKGDAAVTHRHLTLQDLMAQMGHYNAHVRQRALQGLRELAQSHALTILANVSVMLERFLPTFVDEEALVREASIAAWKVLIPVMVEGKSIQPFAKLITMYFCSGLTHLQLGIRQDALKAIDVVLDFVPELISVDAGLEQLGRVIENFRDLVAAADTQGIKVTNSYDLLNFASTTKSSKKNSGDTDLSKQLNGGRARKKSKGSQALAVRFAALNVLHKLLRSVDVDTINEKDTTTARNIRTTKRNIYRMGPVLSIPTLLLYPIPSMVVGNESERLRNVGFWQEKSRTLLKPLYDLWLECFESDSVETLSEEYVENMQKIVESATVILSVNVNTTSHSSHKGFLDIVGKIQEQFMAQFPMFPASNLATEGDAYLSRWYGINVAIAKFANILVELPEETRNLFSVEKEKSKESVTKRVAVFLTSALSKYAQSDELRSLSSSHSIIRALLQVFKRVLSTETDVVQRDALLVVFTSMYTKTSTRSLTFRICTEFAMETLNDLRPWPWSVVLEWLTCFSQYLGSLEIAHMEFGRQCLFTMITIIKQLPIEWAQSKAMETVLVHLEQFFTVVRNDGHKSFTFDALSPSDQHEFVSLVYHIPQLPVSFLRALSSCSKSQQVDVHVKTFLIDIIHQRKDVIDLAHLVSFLMSGLLGRIVVPTLSEQLKHQHLHIVHHVCFVLTTMNLGASLSKILAPALSRQVASLETMDSIDVHTLVLVYTACFASVRPIHRGELSNDFVKDVVRVAQATLVSFAVSKEGQEQERAMLEDVAVLVVMSDNVMSCLLDSLISSNLKGLKAIQFLLRATSVRPWFRSHHAHITQQLSTVASTSDEVATALRQIRGDLELLAVGCAD